GAGCPEANGPTGWTVHHQAYTWHRPGIATGDGACWCTTGDLTARIEQQMRDGKTIRAARDRPGRPTRPGHRPHYVYVETDQRRARAHRPLLAYSSGISSSARIWASNSARSASARFLSRRLRPSTRNSTRMPSIIALARTIHASIASSFASSSIQPLPFPWEG